MGAGNWVLSVEHRMRPSVSGSIRLMRIRSAWVCSSVTRASSAEPARRTTYPAPINPVCKSVAVTSSSSMITIVAAPCRGVWLSLTVVVSLGHGIRSCSILLNLANFLLKPGYRTRAIAPDSAVWGAEMPARWQWPE